MGINVIFQIVYLTLKKKLLSDVIMTLIYIAGYVGRNDDEIHDTCFY